MGAKPESQQITNLKRKGIRSGYNFVGQRGIKLK